MNSVPIVPQLNTGSPAVLIRKAEALAADLLLESEELRSAEEFREFIATGTDDGPALVVDDLSEISVMDPGDNRFYQDRGRLRAGDGDTIVTCSDPIDGYEDYCRDQLGLGDPVWLRAKTPEPPRDLHVAEAAWEDRAVRRELTRRMRQNKLDCIHPHMGTLPVWQLAALLNRSSHRPIRVIAPTPGVSRWANDKVAFSSVVAKLFGSSLIPRSTSAWNLSNAAVRARDIAENSRVVGLKIPDAAGGGGNVVIDSRRIIGRSLSEIENTLRDRLRHLHWEGRRQLLISAWESDVLGSPSAQLWLPASPDDPPVVEGLFMQSMMGEIGQFVGNRPAELPHTLAAEIADRCWLLGRLFQLIGYVGRCSFDLILLGDSLTNSRIEFIECNGRWGGTSLPMTLMNRMFGDWSTQPYAAYVALVPGLSKFSFSSLRQELGKELYDARTGEGRYVLYNPGRIAHQSGISVVGLANDWESAWKVAFEEFPERLQQVVAGIEPVAPTT